eukprot:427742-Prorocentrum_minimum.AAC.2
MNISVDSTSKALSSHLITLERIRSSRRFFTDAAHVRTAALKIHTVALRIHTVALKIHNAALKIHNSPADSLRTPRVFASRPTNAARPIPIFSRGGGGGASDRAGGGGGVLPKCPLRSTAADRSRGGISG